MQQNILPHNVIESDSAGSVAAEWGSPWPLSAIKWSGLDDGKVCHLYYNVFLQMVNWLIDIHFILTTTIFLPSQNLPMQKNLKLLL